MILIPNRTPTFFWIRHSITITIHEAQWRQWCHCHNTSPCWRCAEWEQRQSENADVWYFDRRVIPHTTVASMPKFTTSRCQESTPPTWRAFAIVNRMTSLSPHVYERHWSHGLAQTKTAPADSAMPPTHLIVRQLSWPAKAACESATGLFAMDWVDWRSHPPRRIATITRRSTRRKLDYCNAARPGDTWTRQLPRLSDEPQLGSELNCVGFGVELQSFVRSFYSVFFHCFVHIANNCMTTWQVRAFWKPLFAWLVTHTNMQLKQFNK